MKYNILTIDEMTQQLIKNFLQGEISDIAVDNTSNYYKVFKCLASQMVLLQQAIADLDILLDSESITSESILAWQRQYGLPDYYYDDASPVSIKEQYVKFRRNVVILTLNNVAKFILDTFGYDITIYAGNDLPTPYALPSIYIPSLTIVCLFDSMQFASFDYPLQSSSNGNFFVDFLVSFDNTLERILNEIKPTFTQIVFFEKAIFTGDDLMPPIYSATITYAPDSQVIENGLSYQAVQTTTGNDPFTEVSQGNLEYWDSVSNLNETANLAIRGEYVSDGTTPKDDPTDASYEAVYLRANSSYAYYPAVHLDGASYQVGDSATVIGGYSITKGQIATALINAPQLANVVVVNTATQTATMFNATQGGNKVFAGESLSSGQFISNVKGFTVNDATTDSTTLSDLVVGIPAVVIQITK